jgi:hypothetical protein
MMLSACGSSSSSAGNPPPSGSLSGNWQFSMTNPDSTTPPGTLYGLQGGFLLQKNSSVTGQAVYSVSGISSSNGQWAVCNSGTATITGTVSGQTVTLTAVAGSQTFALTGTLGSDGSISQANFTTAGGTAAGFATCGIPTPAGQSASWGANSVPPLTGSITGNFHSSGTLGLSGLKDQDFSVIGSFTQGPNTGASNATITGTLDFTDPVTLLSNYPCLSDGLLSVNGQISGNSVILQLIATDGSIVGQIGAPAATGQASNVGTWPVTFNSSTSGKVLQSQSTPAYVVNTKACPFPGGSADNHEDSGNICLALNSATACKQPITLSPAVLIFPSQLLGATPTTQTVTLTNTSGSTLSDLTWKPQDDSPGDFTGQSNYTFGTTAGDPCGAVQPGSTFSLTAGQSCAFTVTFSPQQSCPFLPFGTPPIGAPPASCPVPLTGSLTVHTTASKDSDPDFRVTITGAGVSLIQSSARELDFGAEATGEASLPQVLSFTNHSAHPVLILPQSANCTSPLPRPLQDNGEVSGLQVVSNGPQSPNQIIGLTGDYNCDTDSTTHQPNFQISSDTCSGAQLQPQATCSVEVRFVPQPVYFKFSAAMDYFLELNTLQCVADNMPCEIDSGRFPVELRANISSPLRMAPGAGLDFGNLSIGSSSAQQTITLFNDPADSKSATVNFLGKVAVSGNYSETDDCPFALSPGSSCTLTVTFKPKVLGFNQGALTINYTTDKTVGPQIQPVYLRGTGQ